VKNFFLQKKVTVYIPNHNYQSYFEKAIESVLGQTYQNWELILIIDGYNKSLIEIGKKYASQYNSKIKLYINKKKMGLRHCANFALKNSSGFFFTRLDADDFFAKNAFYEFIKFYQNNKKINLIYSDYYYVDKSNNVIDTHFNDKVVNGKSLLNLPAHGACSFVKTSILKKIGGYKVLFDAQDGYELWLNFLNTNSIANIQKVLFFYRQHDQSMSSNENRILEARRKILRHFVKKNKLLKDKKILLIVGARNHKNILFKKINKKYLIDYSLSSIKKLKNIAKVLISTDDEKVLNYNNLKYKFDSYKRPPELSLDFVTTDKVVYHALHFVEKNKNTNPDIVVFINSNAPCIRPEDIQKVIDTLVVFNTDSVTSVYEDFDLHYRHNIQGLKKISERMHYQLRIHRDALFADNRCIKATFRKAIKKDNMLGKKVGHCLMRKIDSINIKNNYDLWLSRKYLKERNKFENI
jgi:CMP-N-acetylneuraminic acid synthetase